MRVHLAVIFLAGAGLMFSSGLAPTAAAQVPAGEKETATAGQDLQGVWNMHATMAEFLHYLASTYTAQEPEMTPWAKQKLAEAKPSFGRDIMAHDQENSLKQTDDPVLKNCYPPGTPRIYLQPFPLQIVQTPTEVIILYEYDHTVRHIYTDGRQHSPDLTPTYMGDSIGHWEGNTLVVDTVGFNEKTWLDRMGHPHSDQLHVIERFTRTSPTDLQIAVTMEDPKALVKPWQATLNFQLKPDWHIMEQVCTDNIDFLNFEH
jgi:hypothetical protein